MDHLLTFLSENIYHVAPIIIAGILGLSIIIERTRMLYFVFPIKRSGDFFEKVRDLVLSERISEALALCEQMDKKPVARVVKEGLLRAHQPEDLIEEGLAIVVSDAQELINARTHYLGTIANVATLLGLLGTIVGLIHSFEAVGSANAQQRSALLAAGISTAMNATMMGLGVAIPCMICFSFLMNKTTSLLHLTEQASARVLDMIKHRYYESESYPFTQKKKEPT